jgi:MoxR-like ATPase
MILDEDGDVTGVRSVYGKAVHHALSMASALACPAMAVIPTVHPAGPADVSQALSLHGYLPDDGLATSVFLALALKRPLLLEGEAGVGKTEVAKVISRWTGGELIRLQCYEGIDASQAVYDWDYSRQLLHLRAAEASGEARGVGTNILEEQLYNERFLLKRALLKAIDHRSDIPPVLLIDEIDRADDEFEAYLLEMLSDYQITIPELGKFTTTRPPIVVLTSNRTRDVHDALKRRCLYHWVEHPDFEREVKIVRMRVPNVIEPLARQVAAAVAAMRALNMYKPPGVAETIDWAQALGALGVTELDEATVESTLGTVLKYREDQERARQHGIASMVKQAFERSMQQP